MYYKCHFPNIRTEVNFQRVPLVKISNELSSNFATLKNDMYHHVLTELCVKSNIRKSEEINGLPDSFAVA